MRCPQCDFSFSVKDRSIPQNNTYWGLIVTPLADHLGLSTKECHELLKQLHNSEIIFIPMKGGIVLEVPKIKTTTTLTTGEFIDYCQRCRVWASQLANPISLKEANEPPPREE